MRDSDGSEIQKWILERLLNSQWCFSQIKKEVHDPGSNPLPLDRVAKVLSNCATRFTGPQPSVLIYKQNGGLFVYRSKIQTNTDILMKNGWPDAANSVCYSDFHFYTFSIFKTIQITIFILTTRGRQKPIFFSHSFRLGLFGTPSTMEIVRWVAYQSVGGQYPFHAKASGMVLTFKSNGLFIRLVP